LLAAFDIHPKTINDSFTRADIERLLPALAHVKFNGGCKKSHGHATWKSREWLACTAMKPLLSDILVGVLTVTFVNCSALGGAVILPFRKKPAFKWILSAFIGLGKIDERTFMRLSNYFA
jgi:hypothetical protein